VRRLSPVRGGRWLKTNPIPAQYPVWGSFITLADKNQEALRGILKARQRTGRPALARTSRKSGISTQAAWIRRKLMRKD